MERLPLTPEPGPATASGSVRGVVTGLEDPVAWFARPLVDAEGLDGDAGSELAERIETIAAAVLSGDPSGRRRLSRHDTVAFLQAVRAQIAHLEALHAHAAASLTLDAAYHGCDTDWARDDGTGRACPTCTATDQADGQSAADDPAARDSSADAPSADDQSGEEPPVDTKGAAWSRSESPVGRVGMELSPALGVSPTFATQLVDDAVDLISELPATWAAMAQGRVDAYRARIIAQGTRPLIDNVDASLPDLERAADHARRERLRASIETRVLGRAAERTGEQLRRQVRRLVVTADPTLAQHARRHGVADRRVGEPSSHGDGFGAIGGLGSMTLHGPIEDLRALHVAIDAAARRARTVDKDPRTLDQLRFDILTGTGWSALRHGHLGCCAPHQPGIGDALGTPGVRGSREVPERTGADVDGDDGFPARSSAAATLTGPARLVATRGRRPVEIRVTVSLATLLGLTEDPADLAGIGPIPADVAVGLAFSEDATWRRLITDPLNGALLDYGHTTYRPPAALDSHVRARDGTSRFPTSITPADHTDLDHTEPYRHGPDGTAADHACIGAACPEPGGRTAHFNLGALSRRPHNARTKHHWILEQPEPGRFQWTSPAHRRYTVDPHVLEQPDPGILAVAALADDPLLLHRSATETDRAQPAADGSQVRDDDDPPF